MTKYAFRKTIANHRIPMVVPLLLLAWAAPGRADAEKGDSRPARELERLSASYCGILSLYAYARLQGVFIPFETLVNREYISTPEGSTLEDLQRAAVELGFAPAMVKNISVPYLYDRSAPLILHVKRDPVTSARFDHYILFLGIEHGKARILDLPNPPQLMDFFQLETKMSGYGLAPAKPGNRRVGGGSSGLRYAAVFSFGVIGLLFISLYQHTVLPPVTRAWRPILARAASSAFIISWCSVGVGVTFNLGWPSGLLANRRDILESVENHYSPLIANTVRRKEVDQKIRAGNVVIVDARFSQDFQQGHIENAINVPVNLNDEEFTKVIGRLAPDMEIIVYCQSVTCPFSDVVARRLKQRGFSHLLIYRGGWEDWRLPAMNASASAG